MSAVRLRLPSLAQPRLTAPAGFVSTWFEECVARAAILPQLGQLPGTQTPRIVRNSTSIYRCRDDKVELSGEADSLT